MTRILLTLIAIAGVIGCDRSPTPSDSERAISAEQPIRVTATVGMVADLVRRVGGERVEVIQICGSGVDPHLYQVTRDDVVTMRAADLIFYSGLMLEGKMTDALVKEARRRPVVAVTEELDPSVLLEPDEFEGHYDPHVWMDVSAWSNCVDVVRRELAAFDPEGAALYDANAKAFQDELKALHQYGKDRIATIPEESRVLVTSHDAFNYFGRAYNLEVIGVQGISTESETGLRRINDLVQLLVDRNVRSVFVESSVSSANVEALVEGAKAKGHDVAIGEKELFSDAMGAAGTYEGTYIGMLDHNITTVTRGLGGEAPEAGFRGKLAQ
jgi:manganese/zinc/iron transport system substrate-binding protein